MTQHYITLFLVTGSRLLGQIPIMKGNEAERKRKSWTRDGLAVYHTA